MAQEIPGGGWRPRGSPSVSVKMFAAAAAFPFPPSPPPYPSNFPFPLPQPTSPTPSHPPVSRNVLCHPAARRFRAARAPGRRLRAAPGGPGPWKGNRNTVC